MLQAVLLYIGVGWCSNVNEKQNIVGILGSGVNTESAISLDTYVGWGCSPNLRAEEKLHCDCTAKNINIQSSANLSPNIGIQGDGGLCTVLLGYIVANCLL